MDSGQKQGSIKYLGHGVRAVMQILALVVGRWVAFLMPRDPKKILFGAWWGQQFSDNPKYFLKYLLDLNQGFKCYWVGNEEIRSQVEACPGVRFVRKGSIMVRWHILTAKWACFNLGFDCDITPLPTYGKLQLLSFWHGTAFKGALRRDYVLPQFSMRGLGFLRAVKVLRDKLLFEARTLMARTSLSSKRMVEIMPCEVPWLFSRELSISSGTPKIDFLINNQENKDLICALRKKYAKMLDLPIDKKWYLYMPTWRNGLELSYSFSRSPMLSGFQEALKSQNAVLVEKQHPQVISALNIESWHQDNIYVVPNAAMPMIDTQELLLCSNRLVSDYSSCLFDFECMGRPVIHYAYDYEEFKKNDRGVEYELYDIAAGPVARTEAELLSVLKMRDEEIINAKGGHWLMPIDGERGKACETFARWVGLVK